MDNALYRQGMNRNMNYPVQRGGANNSATKTELWNGLEGLKGSNPSGLDLPTNSSSNSSNSSNLFLELFRRLGTGTIRKPANIAPGNGSSSDGPADAPAKSNKDEGETVSFKYEPGDSFGQKIIDLGLATDNGLWGEDGDIAYYTRQLRDQGALDSYGNIILGKSWKLKKRK